MAILVFIVWCNIVMLFCTLQVIPKMTAGIASEVDHLLGNRPHSKKDYHH